jgi:hypothetical protein
MSKMLTVTWDQEDDGRLVAKCDEDHTLASVIKWPTPITPTSDSWAIACAVTEVNGAEILSVDHDRDTVFVIVSDGKANPIEVRRRNGETPYGPWMDADDWEVPGWVDGLARDAAASGATSGIVGRGGSNWSWRIREPEAE